MQRNRTFRRDFLKSTAAVTLAAPALTAMLHAGVLKKFGLYGLIRIAIPFCPEVAQSHLQLIAQFAAAPGVEDVVPIAHPFKLVSRQVKRERTSSVANAE